MPAGGTHTQSGNCVGYRIRTPRSLRASPNLTFRLAELPNSAAKRGRAVGFTLIEAYESGDFGNLDLMSRCSNLHSRKIAGRQPAYLRLRQDEPG